LKELTKNDLEWEGAQLVLTIGKGRKVERAIIDARVSLKDMPITPMGLGQKEIDVSLIPIPAATLDALITGAMKKLADGFNANMKARSGAEDRITAADTQPDTP